MNSFLMTIPTVDCLLSIPFLTVCYMLPTISPVKNIAIHPIHANFS